MKNTPENQIKNAVKQYLNLMGWFVFHNLQGLGSYPGIPDLIAIKNGIVIFIECKVPKGKLTPSQHDFSVQIRDHGGCYIVVRYIEDLIKYEEAVINAYSSASSSVAK